jgi:hypothetical protein
MTASPDTKVQINFKGAEPPLVNVYATTGEELQGILTNLNWSLVAASAADYAAAFTAAGSLGARPVGGPSAPSSEGGNCPHGSRVYKTGQGKKGKWEGYFCPTRAQGCEPKWKD